MRPPPLPHYPDWRNAAGEEASSSTGRHCRPPEPKSAIWATTKQLTLLREMRFFYFYIFFSIFQKYIPFFFANLSRCRRFIRQKRVIARWTGGRGYGPRPDNILPVQLVVGGHADGAWWTGNLPPVEIAVAATYRRLIRRYVPTAESTGGKHTLLMPGRLL